MMNVLRKLLPYAVVLLMCIALTVFEADYLYRAQEQNLFLSTPLFFHQCMATSGGLLTWLGVFLTQFFHYPALGAGILCLLWVFLIFLLKRTFRLSDKWVPLTLVSIGCLVLTITTLGYWVFYLKLHGALFIATLGTITAVVLALFFTLIPQKFYLRPLFITLSTCISYPLFGFYGLWGTALMGIMAWRTIKMTKRERIICSLVAVFSIIIVPILCYKLLYHETNIVNIYWTALPVFCRPQQRYFEYYIPYIVLVASTIMMGTFFSRHEVRCTKCEDKTDSKTNLAPRLNGLLLAITVVFVAIFWYKDENFHCELSLLRSIEQQQWEQAVETSAKVKGEPTRAICLMRNLALFRLGRQGEEMYRYPIGAKRPNAPFPIRMVDTVGRLLYLEYGIPNYCYRWCMEDGVEYGWSVEKLKLMAKCSLLNGEAAAAQKYLSLLKKCLFQKDWVKKYTDYAHHPQQISHDPELEAIAQLQRKDNFLTADQGQLERFLLEHFATTQTSNPFLQEQVLIAAMQTKNAQLFWQQFYQYTELHVEDRVPRHYQEAACLFGHLLNIDVRHMPFDAQVVADYQSFIAILSESQRMGTTMEHLKSKLYDRFHTTYYYDYYFNRYNFTEE